MYRILVTGVGAIIGYGIIRSLRQCRYPVHIVGMDVYEDAVGRHWCDHFERAAPAASPHYPAFISNLLRKHAIDLVIPGIEQDVRRMSAERGRWRGEHARFVLNDDPLIEIAHDKWLLHQRLLAAGVPAIPTLIAGCFHELAEVLGAPFLLKPRRSYASKGIQKIFTEEDLGYWRSKTGDQFMVQQIVGNEEEEYTASVFGLGDGAHTGGIVLRRKLSGEGATVKARVEEMPAVGEQVDRLIALFRPVGPTNLQFRLQGSEALLLEINPRISSATSLRTAFGFNEAEMCIEYYLKGETPARRTIRPGGAIRYIEDVILYDSDPV